MELRAFAGSHRDLGLLLDFMVSRKASLLWAEGRSFDPLIVAYGGGYSSRGLKDRITVYLCLALKGFCPNCAPVTSE